MKSCAIIGHRKIAFSDELRQKIKRMIIYLILNENVDVFRFSSRSQFVDVVWEIVSYLQETTFPYIKMVAYDCKNELSILTKDKEKTENLYANFLKMLKLAILMKSLKVNIILLEKILILPEIIN